MKGEMGDKRRETGAELFDIGVNLTGSAFRDDRDAVVERARDAGITRLMLIGSDLADSEAAIKLAETYEGCFATAVGANQAKPGAFLYLEGQVLQNGRPVYGNG